PVPSKPPPPPLPPDEQALKSANLANTGPALLEFFRKRAQAEDNPTQVAQLINLLGDQSVEVRDRAAGELVQLGLPAVDPLRQAANSLDDLDTASRARRCLQAIEGPGGAALVVAAVRQLMRHKPVGAAEALLTYLPMANDDNVVNEAESALVTIAWRDGKLEPVLLKALDDPLPVRRAVAAAVLCQVAKDEEHRAAVRRLLKDPKPAVRLRAALGLANLQEVEAIPV